MRLLRKPQPEPADPFAEISEWADSMRNAVVTEIDPSLAATTAQQAAINSIGAAASITTAAGIAAGATTGGTTMTSATATYNAATSVFSSVGAKAAAWILAGVTVTGGLAATGNLPDTAQNAAANLVEQIGIELPRPALDGIVSVNVGAAGSVSLEAVDGVLNVVDMAALAGWEAAISQVSNGDLTVTFTGDGETMTLAAVIDASGNIVTDVTDVTDRAILPLDEPTAPQGEGRVDGSVDGSVSIDNGGIELGSEISGSLGLGN